MAAQTGDAVWGDADLRQTAPQLKHAAIRTQKMVMLTGLAVQAKAFSSSNEPASTGQRFPENSTSETLSP